MQNKLNIFPVTSADMPLALEMLRQAATAIQQKGFKQWHYWLDPPEERLEWLRQGFDAGQFYFFEYDNQIAGMYRLMTVDLMYWGKQDQAAFYIHSLVVLPEFAGKKIGAQIITFIGHSALQANVSLLRLDCDASNYGLCSYYEQLGFTKVGQKHMPHSLNNLYEMRILQ